MTDRVPLTPEQIESRNTLPWLHIYGQSQWHDTVMIKGNTRGLQALRDAISRALEYPRNDSTARAFVSDGEGYQIQITRMSRFELENQPLPYSDPIAKGSRQ